MNYLLLTTTTAADAFQKQPEQSLLNLEHVDVRLYQSHTDGCEMWSPVRLP